MTPVSSKKSWGQFHVTDITFRDQFLGKLISLTKLFSSFQFIICANIPHRALDRKETFLSLTKASKIFVLNSVTDTTKKSSCIFCRNFFYSLWWPIYNLPQLLTLNYSFKCNFLCSLDTSFLVNWMLSVLTKSFNNDRNKAAS